jgi:hypothetical protein
MNAAIVRWRLQMRFEGLKGHRTVRWSRSDHKCDNSKVPADAFRLAPTFHSRVGSRSTERGEGTEGCLGLVWEEGWRGRGRAGGQAKEKISVRKLETHSS